MKRIIVKKSLSYLYVDFEDNRITGTNTDHSRKSCE